jgi:chromosome partitioning protein
MRKIAILNQKGGVGKTTTAVNLSSGLRLLKKKVLVIDLDAQSHLTFIYGIKADNKSIYEVLLGQIDASDAVVDVTGVHVIPCRYDMANIEEDLPKAARTADRLKNVLANVKGYDFAFFDCPPNLGFVTINALVAACEVYVPVPPHVLPVEGLVKLKETVKEVKTFSNKDLEITGVITTLYDSRLTLHREIRDQLNQMFPETAFKTVIRNNVSLAEMPAAHKDIFNYKPDSNGAEDYLNLCQEILDREAAVNG